MHLTSRRFPTATVLLMLLALSVLSGCKKDAPDTVANTPTPEQNVPAPTAPIAQNGNESDVYKRYGIESAVIVYEKTGDQTGTETVYFDRWGMREAIYSVTSMQAGNEVVTSNQLTLFDGDYLYIVDLDSKTGTKTRNTQLTELAESAGTKDLGELGKTMMEGMGGRVTGTNTIAGKTCDVWEIESLASKSCVWENIPLSTDVSIGGLSVASTAKSVDTDTPIAEEKLTVPADVTLEEIAQG